MTSSLATGRATPSLNDVSATQWEALSRHHLFFGHQSVGGNILAGVADVLAANPAIRLTILETRTVGGAEPALRHAAVGRNDHPLEKFADFVALAGELRPGAVAMVKLCYVDIHGHTDAEALFADYQRHVTELRARRPDLVIVHFTVPLTGIENWKGRLRMALAGHTTSRTRNVIRHRYNELVRAAFEGREPLFDIARMESTLPDGSRAEFRAGGEMIPMLAPRYTDDGGHLNATGRRVVAEQFLVMLARQAAA